MNFYLKNIEIALDEEFLMVGEKLLEEGMVVSLFESDRNLWVAVVGNFETEIQISPSKVKACSCECPVFGKNKMCGHVVAGLLALRKHLSEKKQKPSKKNKPTTYQKLTTNAVLEQIGHEELQAFVRYYARRNRQFAIALQTRFAGSVQMADTDAKYRQVIDAVVKSSRNKNNTISAAGVKQILVTAEDLVSQANDAIALEHFLEAWAILNALLEKVVPAANRVSYETEVFVAFTDEIFETVRRLIHLSLPPDLMEDIWNAAIDMVTRPAWRGYDRAVELLKLLDILASDLAKRNQFLHVIQQEEKKSHMLSKKHNEKLLASQLIILSKKGFKGKANTFYGDIVQTPDKLLSTVSIAIENGLFKEAKSLAEKGLKKYDNSLFQYRLKVNLLSVAQGQQDAEAILQYATDCYIESGNLSYFHVCKKHADHNWKAYVKGLLEKIKASGVKNQMDLLAGVYAEEKMMAQLSELLKATDSLDVLMKYDKHYLAGNLKEIEQLYIAAFDSYFKNHLGIKPTQKMLQVFAHLRQQGGSYLVDKLASFVRKKHPQRMELAMELMTLQ